MPSPGQSGRVCAGRVAVGLAGEHKQGVPDSCERQEMGAGAFAPWPCWCHCDSLTSVPSQPVSCTQAGFPLVSCPPALAQGLLTAPPQILGVDWTGVVA